MLSGIRDKIRGRLEEAIASAIWLIVLIPTWGRLLAWLQEEKTELAARCLLLLLALLAYLSFLYVASLIREKRTHLDYRRNLYWLRNDKHPFCPVCFDGESKRVRPYSCEFGENKEGYRCATCGYQFVSRDKGDFVVEKRFK
jgi:hypothetical protein